MLRDRSVFEVLPDQTGGAYAILEQRRLLLMVIPARFANYFSDVDGVPDSDRDAIRALCAKFDVEILD